MEAMHLSSSKNPFGKSFTPKRYLHAPFSENIVTMWPNAMVLIGEIDGGAFPQKSQTGKVEESNSPSAAMTFLYKEKMLDFKKVKYSTHNDGLPIHKLSHDLGDFSIEMESFCNSERVSTVFTKLVIHNNTSEKISDVITLFARTAPEFDLLGISEPDGYTVYEPSASRWKLFPEWEHGENTVEDKVNKYCINYITDNKIKIVDSQKLFNNFVLNQGIYFYFTLEANEDTVLYFSFGRNIKEKTFSYETELCEATAFWNSQLSRINIFPNKENPDFYKMYRTLVSSGLQMFQYPKGCNYVLLRQGGLQRRIWPESLILMEALAKIGDFEEYYDRVLNTYFHVLQDESGKIVNFGQPWASVTGYALGAFSTVAKKHKNLFDKYKMCAYKAFSWMQKTRVSNDDTSDLIKGLFPPAIASDYPGVAQYWSTTDAWNYCGYKKYAECLEFYNDENAKEVIKATEDYKNVLNSIFNKTINEYKEGDFLLPLDARNKPLLEAELQKLVTHNGQFQAFILLFSGIAGYGTENAQRVIDFYINTKKEYKNGLALPSQEANITSLGNQWYLNWVEYKLYFYCRNSGDDKLAKELLDAQFKYSMTNEFYLSERYDDHDAYFTPWCPNCSAIGRTLLMICDWYCGEAI